MSRGLYVSRDFWRGIELHVECNARAGHVSTGMNSRIVHLFHLFFLIRSTVLFLHISCNRTIFGVLDKQEKESVEHKKSSCGLSAHECIERLKG